MVSAPIHLYFDFTDDKFFGTAVVSVDYRYYCEKDYYIWSYEFS